jgi:hypothetical protein
MKLIVEEETWSSSIASGCVLSSLAIQGEDMGTQQYAIEVFDRHFTSPVRKTATAEPSPLMWIAMRSRRKINDQATRWIMTALGIAEELLARNGVELCPPNGQDGACEQ